MKCRDQRVYAFTVQEVSQALADYILKTTGEKIEERVALVSNLSVDPTQGVLVWTIYPNDPTSPPSPELQ